MLRCDALARNHLTSSKDFWKDVKKSSSTKSMKFANCVDGIVGDENIANMWRNSFESLYNIHKHTEELTIDNYYARSTCCSPVNDVSIHNVQTAVENLKLGQSCGPDGIFAEAIKFGGSLLIVHTSGIVIQHVFGSQLSPTSTDHDYTCSSD